MEHVFKYPGMSGICSIDISFLEFHLFLTKPKTITDIVSDNKQHLNNDDGVIWRKK